MSGYHLGLLSGSVVSAHQLLAGLIPVGSLDTWVGELIQG